MVTEPTRKHVLVVDDEPDFATLLRSFLTKAGYTVAMAHTTEDALAQARERRPDLITLDIHMPRRSGVFFYRKLMLDQAFHSIPVVVVTAVTRDNEMENLIKRLLETDDLPRPKAYLEKPVEGPRFLKTVRQAFASSDSG
jgi:CheY-like chemotaxis protein